VLPGCEVVGCEGKGAIRPRKGRLKGGTPPTNNNYLQLLTKKTALELERHLLENVLPALDIHLNDTSKSICRFTLMTTFRLRLNCIDHYQAVPTRFDPQPHFDQNVQADKRPRVPVIRVFGSTETGQKVCAHLHGAFPYLYVKYDGSLDPEVCTSLEIFHQHVPLKVC
jgi:hypothetical protein